ncbi:MAG: pantetheine-phosphate adenylyltransferase, partial [Candidatus Bathyarchaeota archaeon]|nr:pantetheine-phosphate adenylyltransferase [Candidatus Bathyarchaeota archaeon]
MKRFRKVAVGGTFDELHKGHKALLMKAFEIGTRVLIGLCADEFVKKMGKPHITASYEERLKELQAFLKEQGLIDRAEIIPLNDPYGNTLTDMCIEALVVSEETEKTALKINQKRIEANLPPLEIVTIRMVPAE